MKKLTLSIFFLSILISSCQRELLEPPVEKVTVKATPCIEQKVNPTGRSYSTDSLVEYNCTEKHCGFLPLSTKNYWVYEDSVFSNGVFVKVQMDTLRFNTTYKSLQDGLIWWKPNMGIGLPRLLYTNDSSFFAANESLLMPEFTNTRKDYGLFAGDSVKYLGSFEDVAAQCRSLKIETSIKIPAGSYSNYLYFEKNARFFGRDQLYYKPGIGILKYVQERATPGSPQIKLLKVCTLVSYHIE